MLQKEKKEIEFLFSPFEEFGNATPNSSMFSIKVGDIYKNKKTDGVK